MHCNGCINYSRNTPGGHPLSEWAPVGIERQGVGAVGGMW